MANDAIFHTSRVRDRFGQDSIHFIVMVDADGRATSCELEGAAGETVDGQDACQSIVRSARFDPALDADGEPMASFVVIETAIYTSKQFIF